MRTGYEGYWRVDNPLVPTSHADLGTASLPSAEPHLPSSLAAPRRLDAKGLCPPGGRWRMLRHSGAYGIFF